MSPAYLKCRQCRGAYLACLSYLAYNYLSIKATDLNVIIAILKIYLQAQQITFIMLKTVWCALHCRKPISHRNLFWVLCVTWNPYKHAEVELSHLMLESNCVTIATVISFRSPSWITVLNRLARSRKQIYSPPFAPDISLSRVVLPQRSGLVFLCSSTIRTDVFGRCP